MVGDAARILPIAIDISEDASHDQVRPDGFMQTLFVLDCRELVPGWCMKQEIEADTRLKLGGQPG